MAINGRIGDDILLEEQLRREEIIHIAASAIDSKASQVFAGSAVLVVVPVALLVLHPSRTTLVLQSIACALLLLAVILAHLALAATDYDATGADEYWRDTVVQEAGSEAPEKDVRDLLTWALLDAAKARNKANERVNASRLCKLWYSRGCMLLALGFTTTTLIVIVATGHA